MINNANFDVLRKINKKPVTPSDGLSYNETGKTIFPFYDFLLAGKASVDTYTRYMGGSSNPTKDGALGCAVGMSIVYLRAAGHYLNYKTSVDYSTIGFGESLDKDTINWKKLDNWKDAQPGDFVNTKTNGPAVGHIGIVSDTKYIDDFLFNTPTVVSDSKTYKNPYFSDNFKKLSTNEREKRKSWDIISNSGGGFVGGIGGVDVSKNGSIQTNYSIYKWGLPADKNLPIILRGVALRKNVGPTYAYRFIGTWEKTIGWTCCSRSNPKNSNLPKPK